ncbi:hypothetical protein [Halorubrum sp. Eb13]|nr:hypothetical protein [Halorubrum sp. Eb13]
MTASADLFGLSATQLETIMPVLLIAILVLGGAYTLFVLSTDST